MKNKRSYSEAKKELEDIVKSLEIGDVDVDTLTKKVERSAELITFCKDKLMKTDEELQKILNELP